MAVMKTKKDWQTLDVPYETFVSDAEFQFLGQVEELDSYEFVKANKLFKNLKSKKAKECIEDLPKIDSKKKLKKKKVTTKEKVEERQTVEEVHTPIDDDNCNINMSDKAFDLVEKQLKVAKVKLKRPASSKSGSTKAVKRSKLSNVQLEPSSFSNSIEGNVDTESFAWNSLGLSDQILKALKDLGFAEPTAIQKLCIPPAIRDKLDILGAAETGSGKTLAFAIPIVERLLNQTEKTNGPKALILTPTRELALQIKQHISAIIGYTKIKITTIIGGFSIQKQERLLKTRPEILVATPGRLWAMIDENNDYLKRLPEIDYLVIDETDRMVEKGHFMELSSILNFIKGSEEVSKRQTFIFSATLTFVHPPPKRLMTKAEMQQMTPKQKIDLLVSLTGLREERKVVDITRKFGTAESLTETRLNCSNLEEKDTYLYYFLVNYPGRTLIFANSVNCTRRLKNLLNRLKFEPLVLHAQMHQKQRLKNLEKFAESTNAILLATDVAARGLDIKNIQHVVHYQVPRTTEIYVHRSGRTARACQEGLSVLLVDGQDALTYSKLCKSLNRAQDFAVFPINFVQIPMLRERLKLASELESLEYRQARSSATDRWFRKTAEEAGLELDDDEALTSIGETPTERSKSSEISALQKQLHFLLKQPLNKGGLTTKYPTSLVDGMIKRTEMLSKNSALEMTKVQPVGKKVMIAIRNVKIKDRKKLKQKKRMRRRKK